MTITSFATTLMCCNGRKAEHFLESAKILSCGHMMCNKCIEETNHIVQCGRCGLKNTFDVTGTFNVNATNTLIQENMKEISKIVYDKIEDIFNQIISEAENLDNKIDNQFDFLEDDLEVHIESLKNSLDDIRVKIMVKMNEARIKMKQHVQESYDFTEFDIKLEKYKEDIEKNSVMLNDFYEFNRQQVELVEKLKNLKEFNFLASFSINDEFSFDENSIGSIKCSYNHPLRFIAKQNVQYIPIQGAYQMNQIFKLPNECFLIGTRHSLRIYNQNFNYINMRKGPRCRHLYCHGVALDSDNNVYVTDSRFNQLVKLNHYTVTKIRESDCTDIFVYKDKLYGCSESENEIIEYSLNTLSTQRTFTCKYEPKEIKILNDIVCIKSVKPCKKTYFYKFENFQAIAEYDIAGSILAYDRFFYVYEKDGISAFDNSGVFIEKIPCNFISNPGSRDVYNAINVIDGFLYIGFEGKIVKIPLNSNTEQV